MDQYSSSPLTGVDWHTGGSEWRVLGLDFCASASRRRVVLLKPTVTKFETGGGGDGKGGLFG